MNKTNACTLSVYTATGVRTLNTTIPTHDDEEDSYKIKVDVPGYSAMTAR
jgi:hypothetical protein